MTTKTQAKTAATTESELPDTLAVIELELVVPTDDPYIAAMSRAGFSYFFMRELAREQPAVALLYDVEFHPLPPTRGCFHFEIKIKIKLKKQWKDIKQKGMTLALLAAITAALAFPGHIEKAAEAINKVLDHVQILLRNDQLQYPPTLIVKDIREPSSKDIFPKGGGSFDL